MGRESCLGALQSFVSETAKKHRTPENTIPKETINVDNYPNLFSYRTG